MKGSDKQKPFRELDHTADLRIEVRGKDEQDLFRNAVESLYVLLGLPAVPEGREAAAAEGLRIHGRDREEVLVRLLGELLYKATVERQRLHLHDLSVRKAGEGGCGVVLSGVWQTLTDREMAGQREIKAVTYHDVQIRRTQGGFSARLVMDL